jgi:hypothetical protein
MYPSQIIMMTKLRNMRLTSRVAWMVNSVWAPWRWRVGGITPLIFNLGTVELFENLKENFDKSDVTFLTDNLPIEPRIYPVALEGCFDITVALNTVGRALQIWEFWKRQLDSISIIKIFCRFFFRLRSAAVLHVAVWNVSDCPRNV